MKFHPLWQRTPAFDDVFGGETIEVLLKKTQFSCSLPQRAMSSGRLP
ncbi:hypothetical protein SynBOUM118_00807 [Synechococcus sp. BOUM118]|nr:hypothetical protein SynBOUM118_00807 [Synechococcus sp. BOUM118]